MQLNQNNQQTMKQKFYDWIYRTLRRFGITSTEYANLNDTFNEALQLSGGQHFISVRATINRYRPDRPIETEFSIYDERLSHFYGNNPKEALQNYKATLDIRQTQPSKQIEV